MRLRMKGIAEKSRQALTEEPGIEPESGLRRTPTHGHRVSVLLSFGCEEFLSSLPRKDLENGSEEKGGRGFILLPG
jgi:hypothetical protein